VRTGEGLAPRRFSSQNFYVPGVKLDGRYFLPLQNLSKILSQWEILSYNNLAYKPIWAWSRRPSQSCFSWSTRWTRDHVTVLRPGNFEGSDQESNPGPLPFIACCTRLPRWQDRCYRASRELCSSDLFEVYHWFGEWKNFKNRLAYAEVVTVWKLVIQAFVCIAKLIWRCLLDDCMQMCCSSITPFLFIFYVHSIDLQFCYLIFCYSSGVWPFCNKGSLTHLLTYLMT